ncbi:MAG: S9 family peptidase [Cytophagales bacterium]|nr:S9 family peptidase [Armatimonadota bacterium]
MRPRLAAVLLCAALTTLPGRARSQALGVMRPLPVEAVLDNHTFLQEMEPAVSSDGRWVAYTLQDGRRRLPEDEDERYHWFGPTGVSLFAGQGCDVYVSDLTATGSGAGSRRVSGGRGTSWGGAWSPDGRRLAFYSDRDGAARLWVWERDTGKLRRVSAVLVRPLTGGELPRWTPDGRSIVCKVLPENMTLADAAKLFEPTASPPDASPANRLALAAPVVVYRSVSGADTSAAEKAAVEYRGLLNRARADLALIDSASGTVRRLARNVYPHGYWVSPDGRSVAYTSIPQVGGNPAENRCDLWLALLEPRETEPRLLAGAIPRTWWGQAVRWSPDGSQLAYLSFGEQGTRCTFLHPITGNLPADAPKTTETTGASRDINEINGAPLWDPASGKAVFFLSSGQVCRAEGDRADQYAAPDGIRLLQIVHDSADPARLWRPAKAPTGSVYFRAREEATKTEGIWRLTRSGGDGGKGPVWKRLYGAAVRTGGVAGRGSRLVLAQESADQPPDLWVAEGENIGNLQRASRTNPAVGGYALGTSRVIEWTGSEGKTLRGALLLPPGYPKRGGERLPLIVRVYPGAMLSTRANNWGGWLSGSENAQLFLTRGYAVLLPDLPFDYARSRETIPAAVLPGVDRVIEMGVADAKRVGVIGHSQGGYGVLTLLTTTNRFQAAVCASGFGSVLSSYGQLRLDGEANDVAFREMRLGGSPWQVRERYLENSPTLFLDRVTTPVLLIHGGADRTVGPQLAAEVFVGLRRLGKTAEFARYAGEGHAVDRWSAASREDYARRVLDWFDRHLKQTQP